MGDILFKLDQIFENLPEDQEQANYNKLETCHSYRNEITTLFNATKIFDIFSLMTSPEQAFHRADLYSKELQKQYVGKKIKQATTLIEAKNLRQQLHELIKQIDLRLLS